MTLHTDDGIRKAIQYVREHMPRASCWAGYNGAVLKLIGYISERLPVETKPARSVMWTPAGASAGTIEGETVFEDELSGVIVKLVSEGAHSISISASHPKNVR